MSEGAASVDARAFVRARESYRQARNSQRVLIANSLASAGFTVKTHGNAGRGLTKYTSGGRLSPPFDLSGWMWVAGERDGVLVTVSLQVLDQDPNSFNVHALIDRIGVDVYRVGASIDEADPLFEHATTGLQLPLSTADLTTLLALIEHKVNALA